MNLFNKLAVVSCAAIAAVGLFSIKPASAQVVELKASLFTIAGNPFNKAMDIWADDLKKKSGGRLVLKVFPASQMGPAPRQFDLARTGVADIALILHGLTPGRFPLTELSHVPGVLPSSYAGSLAMSEIAPEFLAAEYPGVKIISIVTLRTEIISRMEIRSAKDLAGKRIRAAGSVQSDVLKTLGAVPTLVQPGDMNDALSKGMVDGISTAYSGIDSYKLDDAGKFVAEGDMGSVTFAVVMNTAAYDALAPDLRKLIDDTSGVASARNFGKVDDEDETALREVLIKRGVKINQLTDDGSLNSASKAIHDQALKNAAAKGMDGQKFLDRMKVALAKYAAEK